MEAGERRSGEMTFYVVRHGQTLFNVMGKVQGWCDTPLTDEGVRAAQSLGRGLAEVDFSAAYSSDSGRAVHTLDELLRARGSKVPFGPYDDMRLREWCYGDLEGEPGELLHATLDAGFGAPLSFEEHTRRVRGGGHPSYWRMRIAPAAPSASMPSSGACAGSSARPAMMG